MKQNTQNGTYITIRIHKHYNKNIIYKIKQKCTKHTTIYRMIKKWKQKNMKECDKRNSHIYRIFYRTIRRHFLG